MSSSAPLMSPTQAHSPSTHPHIIIFTLPTCKYCRDLKATLNDAGLDYSLVKLDKQPERRDQMVKLSKGRHTVPQMFVDGVHIGGYDDFQNILKGKSVADWYHSWYQSNHSLQARAVEWIEPTPEDQDEQGQGNQTDRQQLLLTYVNKELQEMSVLADALYVEAYSNLLEVPVNAATMHQIPGSAVVSWYVTKGYAPTRIEAATKATQLLKWQVLTPIKTDKTVIGFVDSATTYYRFPSFPERSLNALVMYPAFMKTLISVTQLAAALKDCIGDLLEKILSEGNTKVDLNAIRKQSRWLTFSTLLCELQRVEDLQFLSTDARKAFFINIYNVMVFHAKLILGEPKKPAERRAFFTQVTYLIGHHKYSLDDIEYGILRGVTLTPSDPRYPIAVHTVDPRIHFALNCGAVSCPPIGVYSPDRLNKELQYATQAFCEGNVFINAKTATVSLSRLWRWYRQDFTGDKKKYVVPLLEWISPFLSPDKKAQLDDLIKSKANKIKLEWLVYDWSPNTSAQAAGKVVPTEMSMIGTDLYFWRNRLKEKKLMREKVKMKMGSTASTMKRLDSQSSVEYENDSDLLRLESEVSSTVSGSENEVIGLTNLDDLHY